MEQEKIDRINALYRKYKTVGLTEDEAAERETLQKEYLFAVAGNLNAQLARISSMDSQGNKMKLKRKG